MSPLLRYCTFAVLLLNAILGVWALINVMHRVRGSGSDLFWDAALFTATLGAYRGWKWAPIAFALLTAIVAIGLSVLMIFFRSAWHTAAHTSAGAASFVISIVLGWLQIATWVQYELYWRSQRPKNPPPTGKLDRAPWDLM